MQNFEDNYSATFESLLKQGFAVIDVRYKNYKFDNNGMKFIIVKIEQDRENFYLNMLKNILDTDIVEKNVYELWYKILIHKLGMSECLKRDVGIKVAALDYVTNEGMESL